MSSNAIEVGFRDRVDLSRAEKVSLQVVCVGNEVPLRAVYDLNISGETRLQIPVNELASARLIATPTGVLNTTDPAPETLLYSTIETTLLRDRAVYDVVVDPELPAGLRIVETGEEIERGPDVALDERRAGALFLNRTGEDALEFNILQIDTAFTPAGREEFGILNMVPTVDLQGGGNDWNSSRQARVALLRDKMVRLLYIFPPDHPKYPLRSITNLDPFTIPAGDPGPHVYQVKFDKCKTRLVVGRVVGNKVYNFRYV